MSRNYKIKNPDSLYFVTFSTVYWIDLFVRRTYIDIIINSLNYCKQNKGLEIYSWCIMPSHLHLILSSIHKPLDGIIRDFKSFTSRTLREEIANYSKESRREWLIWMFERAGKKNNNNNDWQLWQQHNQSIELFSNKFIDQKLNYIHFNPVKAGFVDEPQHWNYSSAKDYYGIKGLINITLIK